LAFEAAPFALSLSLPGTVVRVRRPNSVEFAETKQQGFFGLGNNPDLPAIRLAKEHPLKKLALVVALAASAVVAQQPAAQRPAAATPAPQAIPPVSESVEVSVTSVEVIVTDSKGDRVPGLTRDDFEVRQDGQPQKITNFYAVSGGKVLLEDGKVLSVDEPAVKDELPVDVKARYLIYIDNLNIQPQNRNRMFKRLKEWVAQVVGKNAEAMVVTWNRSLKVRRKFTSEGSDIVGVLETIEMETGGGTTIAGDRRDALSRIDDSQSAAEGSQIARQYAESLRNDLEFTIDALKNTINGLSGVSGRKVLIYVSEGLPSTAGFELFDAVQQKYQQANTLESLEFHMDTKYAGIVQAANAQGVTIWPLDASGLQSNTLMTAENRQIQNRPSDFFMRTNQQAPLQMMAEQTGGKAAINTNDWKRDLDELTKDFSNFYSIGYRTTRSAADRPHSLDVLVKRKGLTVRSRKGFVEKTIETRTAEAVVAALNYPRDDNPLGIALAMGESSPFDGENYQIPARITIPIGKIGLAPTADAYEGKLYIYFIVLDVSGKQSDLTLREQKISVPAAKLKESQAKFFPYNVKMLVVPGGQKISIAVRDAVSNQVSYVQKNFFVSVLPKGEKKGS
jgi:VWFA-related protein